MSDLDDRALGALELALRGLDRRQRPSLLKALMRLSGNALAAMTDNDEAGAEHTRLGHRHFTRGTGR